jgi:hypothetical protein
MWFWHPCVFWHLPCPHHLKTYQGVAVDSLEIESVETGRIIAPDRRQRRQEAPKRCLAMPAWFRCFFANIQRQRGRGNPLYSFHATPQRWGASKGMNDTGGSCPPARSGTPHVSGLMVLVERRRGIVGECVANVIDTQNHFHVSATSSEALSANRRRCRT